MRAKPVANNLVPIFHDPEPEVYRALEIMAKRRHRSVNALFCSILERASRSAPAEGLRKIRSA